MKAKLKNTTSKTYPEALVKLNGFFEFELIGTNDNGSIMYAPIDKNFPSSTPIKKIDLEFEPK